MSTSGKLRNWLQGQKDTSVSFLVEKMLQKKIEPFGRLLEFKLDSRQNGASLKLLLKGETEPVMLWVDEYLLVQSANQISVTVRRARASREWITALLDELLLGKPFIVPEKYAPYVKMLL
jgi:hypothetical protein